MFLRLRQLLLLALSGCARGAVPAAAVAIPAVAPSVISAATTAGAAAAAAILAGNAWWQAASAGSSAKIARAASRAASKAASSVALTFGAGAKAADAIAEQAYLSSSMAQLRQLLDALQTDIEEKVWGMTPEELLAEVEKTMDILIEPMDEAQRDGFLQEVVLTPSNKVIIFYYLFSVLNPQHPFSPYVATAVLPYVRNRILFFVCFFLSTRRRLSRASSACRRRSRRSRRGENKEQNRERENKEKNREGERKEKHREREKKEKNREREQR